ncbi:SDR family oxidoreductase [Patescibacteria group bacterium]|nr:SDR family oxidoreductase [Patescibacteria group bacterium]
MIKTALITGSSQGIGRAIAIKLAMEGYTVFITYFRNKEKGERTIAEIKKKGGRCFLIKTNVCSEKSVKRTIEFIRKKTGHLNILVNNAGIEVPKTIEEVSLGEWNRVVDTKINGNFLCTKYAFPIMKNQENANLLIIVSSLGERPDYNYPAYSIGCAGTIAFMKMMAQQLGKFGIRTNAVAPGTTRTAIWDSMDGKNEAMWKKFAKNNPMSRISTPEDIANAVSMLINDKSLYLNGNIIYANGGSHLI